MITSRICTSCKIEKKFEEFGNSKKGKWGKREICKPCKRNKDREYERNNTKKMSEKHARWVESHREHVREYNRQYYEKNPEIYKKNSIEYRKKTQNENVKKYRKKYPHKKKAHAYVEMAVYFGDMVRPEKCSRCEIQCIPQGHHEDYSKPLEVIWLCTACHGWIHRKENHAERLSEKTPKGEAIV